MQEQSQNILPADYWNHRWKTGETGWDIGNASSPLVRYCEQLADKNTSILIPGCGNAYEAEYLLGKGFTNITLLDISAVLVTDLTDRLQPYIGNGLTIICGDFFDHTDSYDLIVEQTFFCALYPAKRQAYANQMYQLLNPAGKLAGVLFDRNFPGGPPFGGNIVEYQLLFGPLFSIEKIELCYNSIPARSGSELFFILKKAK
ncbi:MAG: methyltransferase [Chitinophagaceae bacterium]